MNLFAILAQQAVPAGPAPAAVPQAAAAVTLALLLVAAAAPAWLFVAGRFLSGRQPLRHEGRRPVPWNGADVLMVCTCSFLLQSLLPLALLHWQGFEVPRTGKLPAGAEMTILMSQAVAGIGSLVLVALWLAMRAAAGYESLGCMLRNWRRDLASGLIAATFIIPPVLAVQAILSYLMPSEHPLFTAIKQSPSLLPVATVLAVLIAPLFEEFLFRVVLQGWLEKAEQALRRKAPGTLQLPRGVWPIVLSSLVFAAAHFGHGADPLPLFLFALVLGYLYHQTHRLWPSLVLHMALNALSISVVWLTVPV